jgi:hypothetical protein
MTELKDYFERTSFFVLGIAAVLISAMAWSWLIDVARKPNMTILEFKISTPEVKHGTSFTYTARYHKEKDCPGQWTIRGTDEDGVIVQIASGRLGTRPPGDFTAIWTLEIPDHIPTGRYEINEVIDGICDGGVTFVTRGPFDTLVIK